MTKHDAILGISAFYHDSAAALLVDGQVLAAAQEERFTRKKHDPAFPENAVRYVLEEGGLSAEDVTAVAFYDKPYLKFERLLETYHGFAPKGLTSFLQAIPVWIKEKVFMRKMLRDELHKVGLKNPTFLFPEHHLSHAASAFYPSPFEDAAILTIDGVGEWATTTIGHGKGREITLLREIDFPHSLGLFYSAFTYYCGFRVNSGEYKLMGLAPYGHPGAERVKEWKLRIYDELFDLRDDGSFVLNMDYFNYATGLTMTVDKKWEDLFGVPRRQAETDLNQDYMDLALAVQQVTEEAVFKLADTAKELTGSNSLVMAGGVALNCVANGKLLERGVFDDIWIQPAAGDAGGALGAAFCGWHIWKEKERTVQAPDSMQGAYLGPDYSEKDILRTLRKYNAPYVKHETVDELSHVVADLLDQGSVVGWLQGRMEYGPRALGGRSILGDPRNPEMQKRLNRKIKYRESFRPFAPSVLEEDIQDYFDLHSPSPYMLLVAPVKDERRKSVPGNYDSMSLRNRLYYERSDVPAVTHIDFSARIQSVKKETNYRYWKLIDAFKQKTGYGLIVNTSFNVRGEPIVCTPEDAYRCFMRTEMDYLVLGDFVLAKTEQPEWQDKDNWREDYVLD